MEVQGGHIVRSTGRKDRHSKVCTAKGPRDRRVRLSAHTAIQFYDVQDRLGYDRPSKAVDWLIKKAKAAIDELAELPAWHPTTGTATATTETSTQQDQLSDERDYHPVMENLAVLGGSGSGTTRTVAAATTTVATMATDAQNMEQQQHLGENPNHSSSFLPPSLDSDAIADTIKSFFPMGASVETSSASIEFQSYPPDLLSRTSSQNQDLRLSLQFQEPILLQQPPHGHAQNEQQVLFSGTAHHLGFDGSSAGWSEHHQHRPAEISRFQRMVAWNAGGAADTGSGGGLIFNPTLSQPVLPPPLLQPFFGQNQFSSQRGPLQSSNTPSVRAWIDPGITSDHHHPNEIPQIHQQQSSIFGGGFAAAIGGFSGFRIPARIQGEEEEQDGIHNKLSSASSDSRH